MNERIYILAAALIGLSACSASAPPDNEAVGPAAMVAPAPAAEAGATPPEASAPQAERTEERDDPGEFAALEMRALAGEYGAQRNVAYWLSGGINKPPQDAVRGCAWRLVILQSRSSELDSSDESNKQLYCDRRLTPEQMEAAESMSAELLSRIKIRP